MPSSQHIIDQVIKLWKLKPSLRFVRKVENWIYHSAEDKLYIRLTDPLHRSAEEINAELTWLEYLQAQGVQFAHPVPSIDGTLLKTIDHKDQIFFVSVFREASGRPLKDPADFTSTVCKSWGSILGQLHVATKNYQHPSAKIRSSWDTDKIHLEILERINLEGGAISSEAKRLIKLFQNLPKEKDDFGLIHADLHRGNFHVDENEQVVAFDFDDALHHWFVYDIAVVFYSLEKNEFYQSWNEFAQYFWDGYESHKKIDAKWRALVPEFVKYRGVFLYYWYKKNLKNTTFSEVSKNWMLEKIKKFEEKFT
ncbi:MAG: phosphotransferase [Oligoflexales bacterium]|nr:phosphotransferase [Oligoflexales bacterium]